MDARNDRWVLATPEFLGDPAELEASARADLADAERDGPIPDEAQGADSSNSIWVSVDASGRVESIEISRRWRDQLDAGKFGAALFEAYGDATRRAIEARAKRALLAKIEQDLRSESSERTPPAIHESREADLRPQGEAWFRSVVADIDELAAKLDAYGRMARDGVAPDLETELKSPNEVFTMKLRGRAVVSITADIMQVRRADAKQLRLEALDLFRAADLTSG